MNHIFIVMVKRQRKNEIGAHYINVNIGRLEDRRRHKK